MPETVIYLVSDGTFGDAIAATDLDTVRAWLVGVLVLPIAEVDELMAGLVEHAVDELVDGIERGDWEQVRASEAYLDVRVTVTTPTQRAVMLRELHRVTSEQVFESEPSR